MAVKIRLKRIGAKKKPFYRIVVADARFPRDGRFIEQIGTYDPMTKPAKTTVDGNRALYWISNGAQPTDTVRALLKSTGALEKARQDELAKKQAAEAGVQAEPEAVREATVAGAPAEPEPGSVNEAVPDGAPAEPEAVSEAIPNDAVAVSESVSEAVPDDAE